MKYIHFCHPNPERITKFLNIICNINDTPTPSIHAQTAYQNEQKSQVGHLTDFWFVVLH